MPTYVYRRADGTTFEIEQRITEDALETCPTTGQPVTRVIIGGTGLIFKGNGFYLTDYARSNGSTGEKSGGDGKASEKGSTAADTKPAETSSSSSTD